MDTPTEHREMCALLKQRGVEAEPWHTGGGCWSSTVTFRDNSFVMVTDLDGPWIAGYYRDEEQEEPTWLPGLSWHNDESAGLSADDVALMVSDWVKDNAPTAATASEGPYA